MTELTRRRLLASAGVGAAGIGLGGAAGYLIGSDEAQAGDGTGSVPFYGEHQAGIATPAQDRLHFAAFDLVDPSRAALRELMREWSRAAAEMTAGQMIGDANGVELAPPDDTGETVGLLPSRLTVTFGFGPSLFERRELGLQGKRPAALQQIPPLPADELNEGESGGDICLQAC
jgi:deferrochelatase/peroxidase EfeB